VLKFLSYLKNGLERIAMYLQGMESVFDLLDARHAISVTERQRYLLRVRTLAHNVAQAYYERRESLQFPMCTTGGQ